MMASVRTRTRRSSSLAKARTRVGDAAAITRTTAQRGTLSTPLLVPQRRFVRTVLALAAASLAIVLACPRLAAAEDAAVSLTYRVGAALDHEQRVVRSRGVIVMDHVGRDERDAIPIWLYGDRLQKAPPSLTDASYERLFPYGVSRGGYRHVRLHLAGCDAIAPTDEPISSVRGRIVLVPVCKTATRPYTVEFEADLALPQRYGTLGHTSGATVLAKCIIRWSSTGRRGRRSAGATWSTSGRTAGSSRRRWASRRAARS